MSIQKSGEMYLETIFVLQTEKSGVRSLDVAEHMNFSKPSVSRAMKLLKGEGYIDIDKDGFITLTPEGNAIAAKIYERHTLLTQMLVRLGVDAETASEDACRIEHDISDTSFAAIKAYFSKQG